MACNSNAGLILEKALNNDHLRRRALCLRREDRGMSFQNKSIVQLPICPIRFLLVFGQRSPCRVKPPFKFTTMNLIDDTRTEFGLQLMRLFLVTNIQCITPGPPAPSVQAALHHLLKLKCDSSSTKKGTAPFVLRAQ